MSNFCFKQSDGSTNCWVRSHKGRTGHHNGYRHSCEVLTILCAKQQLRQNNLSDRRSLLFTYVINTIVAIHHASPRFFRGGRNSSHEPLIFPMGYSGRTITCNTPYWNTDARPRLRLLVCPCKSNLQHQRNIENNIDESICGDCVCTLNKTQRSSSRLSAQPFSTVVQCRA